MMSQPVLKAENVDVMASNIQNIKANKRMQLAHLRRQLAVVDGHDGRIRLSLGVDSLDYALAGGLALGRVHLLTGNMLTHAAVSGFVIAVIRHLQTHIQNKRDDMAAGPIVWCPSGRYGAAGMLYGHGLAAVGLDPSQLLIVDTPSPSRRMAALEDILRTGGLTAVIAEYDGMHKPADYWMRLARRAQLAAESSGVTAFLLGAPIPTAGFETAWHICPAPDLAACSNPVLGGRSIWDLQLQRVRGGRPYECRVSWQPNTGVFTPINTERYGQGESDEVLPVQDNLPIGMLPVASSLAQSAVL